VIQLLGPALVVLLSGVLYLALAFRQVAKEALLMLFMVRQDTKSIMQLADVLETIEVTADELLDQRFAPQEIELGGLDGDAALQARLAALRAFVRQVRDLELRLLTKLEQARVRARTVARSDWRLRPILSLFTSGTQPLADHIASPQGREAMRFDGGDQVFPFLRSRELLAPMAEHYDGAGDLLVTDSFRLLGLIKLRDLLERCEVALNALDAHYDLYDWPAEDVLDQEEVVTELHRIAASEAAATGTAEPAGTPIVLVAPVVLDADAATPVATDAAPATNWGAALPAAETPPAPAAPVAETSNTDAQAVAEADAEDGLKSLSERLSELRKADAFTVDETPSVAKKSNAA